MGWRSRLSCCRRVGGVVRCCEGNDMLVNGEVMREIA